MQPLALLACRTALLLALVIPQCLRAEDGYELWLRYRPLEAEWRSTYREAVRSLVVPQSGSPTLRAARGELLRGLEGLLGAVPASAREAGEGALLLGTPETSARIADLKLPLKPLGEEGYLIRRVDTDRGAAIVIAANSDIGVLYGTFHFLRLLQTRTALANLDIVSRPRIQLRLLNHWDNLDRSVERGYAGQSLWDWWRLPDYLDPRYTDYARANASIGINGTVLNNVNASADSLTSSYIAKAAALADVFRPYGIRVYLSARFSAPVEIGGLDTADPLEPAVRAWWKAKAAEIHAAIPDFGGFLVKANSEGQPGPQDYGRSHADGANMLAEALRPYGGAVMWRAFVYSDTNPEDRAKQAYSEFKPLDGRFADNVILQVKNGPIDFQPREPFHPLFGAMPATNLMLELQITKEYLGFDTHLVYLGTLFEEVLDADTCAGSSGRCGEGAVVASVIDGSLHGYRRTGIAGVANIGTDRDWSGSIFNQANWYAFGRLAWNPDLSARSIAEEWLRMTFTANKRFVAPAAGMMLRSRQAAVDYMTPLGLAHLMGTDHHYGPAPWVDHLARPEWNPVYYHRADREGIGFDRTAEGTGAVSQYAPPLARRFGNRNAVPEDYLLWFHHLPWDYPMASGRDLWAELVHRYDRGVAEVRAMAETWAGLESFVDAERFYKTARFLEIQKREARWWRDASIAYFRAVSGRPLPAGAREPARPLEAYRALQFPRGAGN
ncbi:alpha-glucuronidase [Microbulbifer thermotolerans]|uniref:alpha-glucuronidase family glycosyl hydrolase n=1 Tax=Microbulbifer thermotolerans TaxID=252514 RepID=UPI00224B9B25|nr:alpha-glucuronidase family glycosyl hydrolase [Microbulbifer thermotolerans]MCX2842353.1 alpha-glucuronidase [Microbulbifer thermotolerans]